MEPNLTRINTCNMLCKRKVKLLSIIILCCMQPTSYSNIGGIFSIPYQFCASPHKNIFRQPNTNKQHYASLDEGQCMQLYTGRSQWKDSCSFLRCCGLRSQIMISVHSFVLFQYSISYMMQVQMRASACNYTHVDLSGKIHALF